jgi:transposase
MSIIAAEYQTVGIDVSQAWLDIALRPAGTYWRLANQEQGWTALIDHLKSLSISLVVVESTGGMERGIVQALQKADVSVAVINPKRARDFAKASG